MLTANLILVSLVVFKLLINNFKKNKGIVYAIIGILAFFLRVIGEVFPVSYFDQNSLFLRFALIHPLISFLIGPLTLLYMESVLKKGLTVNRYFFLFIPFLVALINYLPYFYLPIEEKIQIYTQTNDALTQKYFLWFSYPEIYTICNIYYNPIVGILTIVYLFQLLIRGKQKLNKKTHSNLLQLGIILTVNFIILRAVVYFKYISNGENISPEIIWIIPMILPLSILLLPNFVYDNPINSDLNLYFRMMNHFSGGNANKDSVKSELLSDSSRIMKYINEEKPYLSAGFSIHDIVSNLDIPQKNVTDCFNKVIKIPFPRMRNQLRVDYAIEMFKNNLHVKISIEGIAIESGFNNRATFYKAFRDVTNTTPIEWIKQNYDSTLEEEIEKTSKGGC